MTFPGMHKKSLEAAEHFKNEDLTSASREGCDTQMTSGDEFDGSPSPINLAAKYNMNIGINSDQQQSTPVGSGTTSSQNKEEIRSNSIASLRAKAQEHCLRLMGDSSVKTTPERRNQILRDPNKPEMENSN